MVTKLLFVEPPKDYWFLMGEYLPPPTGLLILAAYLEGRIPDMEIEIFLVIGFFSIITGIFHLTGSVIYGIFGILISFLWLDTRIQLSSWHHFEVCKNCSETCKS